MRLFRHFDIDESDRFRNMASDNDAVSRSWIKPFSPALFHHSQIMLHPEDELYPELTEFMEMINCGMEPGEWM